MHRARRLLGLMSALGLLVQLCGCAPLQPWVKPYERERLADPVMAFDRDPVSSAYMEHVFDVRSASRGGSGAAGGGCGCN
jgi:hypothetical protein